MTPSASPLVLATEGTAVTASVTVTDKAGNSKTLSAGEFKIDKLPPNSGTYRLEVNGAPGRFGGDFDLGAESRYLGVIRLGATG